MCCISLKLNMNVVSCNCPIGILSAFEMNVSGALPILFDRYYIWLPRCIWHLLLYTPNSLRSGLTNIRHDWCNTVSRTVISWPVTLVSSILVISIRNNSIHFSQVISTCVLAVETTIYDASFADKKNNNMTAHNWWYYVQTNGGH